MMAWLLFLLSAQNIRYANVVERPGESGSGVALARGDPTFDITAIPDEGGAGSPEVFAGADDVGGVVDAAGAAAHAVEADGLGGSELLGDVDGAGVKEAAVDQKLAVDALGVVDEGNGARCREVLPSDVRGLEDDGLEHREAEGNGGKVDFGFEVFGDFAHQVVDRGGVQPAAERGAWNSPFGRVVARAGEPFAFKVFNGIARGDDVSEQRSDRGADDQFGLKVSREDLPGSHMVGAEEGSAGEDECAHGA